MSKENKKVEWVSVEHDRWMMLIHLGDRKIVLLKDKSGRHILISGNSIHVAFAMEYIHNHYEEFNACENCHDCGKCIDNCILGTGIVNNKLRLNGGGENGLRKLKKKDLTEFQDMLYQAVV
ncbi:MAG: hypothetical protein ABH887_00220 [bacterium]